MSVSPLAPRIIERPHQQAGPELTLLQLLEAQALAEGLSGKAQARRLDIDHGHLSRVRRGMERLGVDSCAKIVARHPGFRAAAARYLSEAYSPSSLELLEEASRIVRRAAILPSPASSSLDIGR